MKIIDKNLSKKEKDKLQKKLELLQSTQAENTRYLRNMGWNNGELTKKEMFYILKQEGLVPTKLEYCGLWLGTDSKMFYTNDQLTIRDTMQVWYKLRGVHPDASPNKDTILTLLTAHMCKILNERSQLNEKYYQNKLESVKKSYKRYCEKYPEKNTRSAPGPDMYYEDFIKDVLGAKEELKDVHPRRT